MVAANGAYFIGATRDGMISSGNITVHIVSVSHKRYCIIARAHLLFVSVLFLFELILSAHRSPICTFLHRNRHALNILQVSSVVSITDLRT